MAPAAEPLPKKGSSLHQGELHVLVLQGYAVHNQLMSGDGLGSFLSSAEERRSEQMQRELHPYVSISMGSGFKATSQGKGATFRTEAPEICQRESVVVEEIVVDQEGLDAAGHRVYAIHAKGSLYGRDITSTVQKRFRDCHAFYLAVESELALEVRFPPKKLFGLNAEELREREELLHMFFSHLAENWALDVLTTAGKAALVDFVGMKGEYVGKSDSQRGDGNLLYPDWAGARDLDAHMVFPLDSEDEDALVSLVVRLERRLDLGGVVDLDRLGSTSSQLNLSDACLADFVDPLIRWYPLDTGGAIKLGFWCEWYREEDSPHREQGDKSRLEANGAREERLQLGTGFAGVEGQARELCLEVCSATGIQDVQVFGSQRPYVLAHLLPIKAYAHTAVAENGGTRPLWWEVLRFDIDSAFAAAADEQRTRQSCLDDQELGVGAAPEHMRAYDAEEPWVLLEVRNRPASGVLGVGEAAADSEGARVGSCAVPLAALMGPSALVASDGSPLNLALDTGGTIGVRVSVAAIAERGCAAESASKLEEEDRKLLQEEQVWEQQKQRTQKELEEQDACRRQGELHVLVLQAQGVQARASTEDILDALLDDHEWEQQQRQRQPYTTVTMGAGPLSCVRGRGSSFRTAPAMCSSAAATRKLNSVSLRQISVDEVQADSTGTHVYTIIAKGESNGRTVASTVQKRFRDCHAFFSGVESDLNFEASFPRKSVLSPKLGFQMPEEQLEERRNQLHAFFSRLAEPDALTEAGNTALMDFVGLMGHTNRLQGQEELLYPEWAGAADVQAHFVFPLRMPDLLADLVAFYNLRDPSKAANASNLLRDYTPGALAQLIQSKYDEVPHGWESFLRDGDEDTPVSLSIRVERCMEESAGVGTVERLGFVTAALSLPQASAADFVDPFIRWYPLDTGGAVQLGFWYEWDEDEESGSTDGGSGLNESTSPNGAAGDGGEGGDSDSSEEDSNYREAMYWRQERLDVLAAVDEDNSGSSTGNERQSKRELRLEICSADDIKEVQLFGEQEPYVLVHILPTKTYVRTRGAWRQHGSAPSWRQVLCVDIGNAVFAASEHQNKWVGRLPAGVTAQDTQEPWLLFEVRASPPLEMLTEKDGELIGSCVLPLTALVGSAAADVAAEGAPLSLRLSTGGSLDIRACLTTPGKGQKERARARAGARSPSTMFDWGADVAVQKVDALVMFVDYDGCIVAVSNGGNDMQQVCADLLYRIAEMVRANQYSHVFVVCGSNRQCQKHNQSNSAQHKNGDAFKVLPKFAAHLRRALRLVSPNITVSFEPILTADAQLRKPSGTELKTTDDGVARTIFDHLKVIMMVFLINHMTQFIREDVEGLDNAKVDFVFIDDRADLLTSVYDALHDLRTVCMPEETRFFVLACANGFLDWAWPESGDVVEEYVESEPIVGATARVVPSYAFWASMKQYTCHGGKEFDYTLGQVGQWCRKECKRYL